MKKSLVMFGLLSVLFATEARSSNEMLTAALDAQEAFKNVQRC